MARLYRPLDVPMSTRRLPPPDAAWDEATRVALTLLALIIAAVVLGTVAFAVLRQPPALDCGGIHNPCPRVAVRSAAPRTPRAPLPLEPPTLAPAAVLINEQPLVRVDGDAVRVFFATGQADLPRQARAAFEPIAAAIRAGQHAHIGSFHEAVGDATANTDLAARRARVVFDLLLNLGAPAARLHLAEPVLIAPEAASAQNPSQRVQITLLPK